MIPLSNFVCTTGSVWVCCRKLPTHSPIGENHLRQRREPRGGLATGEGHAHDLETDTTKRELQEKA